MRHKQILLLIGPKGSGKTFIGTLIQKEFHIDFVRVEEWVLKVRKDRNLDDPDYISEVFKVIEEVNSQVLAKNMTTDYSIDNNDKTADTLRMEIRSILQETSHGIH